jgi:hypothetical protein
MIKSIIRETKIKNVLFNGSKYIINFDLKIPDIKIKNELNFRIFEIKNCDNNVIKDPDISNSYYIYNISRNSIGKFVNINFEFDKNKFENINEIIFDFCDEHIAWRDLKVIYKNNFNIKNLEKFNNAILSNSLMEYFSSNEFFFKIVSN